MRIAFATPSYAYDYDRCRLLCRSIAQHAQFETHHYLIVKPEDYPRFRTLTGPATTVVDAEEVLMEACGGPEVLSDPSSVTEVGWIHQQLLKLSFTRLCTDDIVLWADSDMLFLRPFTRELFVCGEQVALFRVSNFSNPTFDAWHRVAHDVLGLGEFAPGLPRTNYVNCLVSWRTDVIRQMLRHVEQIGEMPWLNCLLGQETFSEYTLYGNFADCVLGQNAGLALRLPLACQAHYEPRHMDDRELTAFVEGITDQHQIFMISARAGVEVTRYEGLLAAYL